MINLQTFGLLIGGLGLFLLGKGLMIDGLKLAAGPALHRILAGATRTRAHALGSEMLVTAIVQSSSAVTIAGGHWFRQRRLVAARPGAEGSVRG